MAATELRVICCDVCGAPTRNVLVDKDGEEVRLCDRHAVPTWSFALASHYAALEQLSIDLMRCRDEKSITRTETR